jgi:hypothetical protein
VEPGGVVRVKRIDPGWRASDSLRGYRVLIDDQTVGRLRRGQQQDFQVTPGTHTVRVKIEAGISSEVAIDVKGGDVVTLTCEPCDGPGDGVGQLTSDAGTSIKLVVADGA